MWQALPHSGDALIVAQWPTFSEALCFAEEEKEMERIMEAIRAVRNRRAEMNVPPSRKAELFIETAWPETFRHGAEFLQKLAGASAVTVGESFEIEGAVSIVTPDATIRIPMAELVDTAKEKERLEREKASVQKQLDGVMARLSNAAFTDKAPAAVVQTARDNAARLQEKLNLLEQSLKAL